MVAGVTRERFPGVRSGDDRWQHARRCARLIVAVLLGVYAVTVRSDVIDDVVVLNRDDALRTFNVSSNDNTAGDCAANDPASNHIASCPCEFNASGPSLNPAVFTGSYDGAFSYQPAAGVSGVDTIRYFGYQDTNTANCNGSNQADISVVINSNPVLSAFIPTVSVAEDAVDVVIDLGTHFTDADTTLASPFTDVLAYSASVTATDNPSLFSSVAVSGGTLTLDFAPDESGTATIEVIATDNRASLAAIANFVSGNTVTTTFDVVVTPVNDAPVAVDDSATLDEDASATIDVLANDFDVEGDTISLGPVTQPAGGTLAINPDGTITYTPNADFNGDDGFDYAISDGNGGSDTASVRITVNNVNDAPIANDDSATLDEDAAVTVSVLDNDTDLDGDSLAVVAASFPTHGSVTVNGATTVTYTPEANFNGADSFSYTVDDGSGGSDVGTVNVVVNAVNDAPVALDDTASTSEDTAVIIDVLANDTDVDGDPVAVVGTPAVSNGTVTLNGDGTLTFAPDANFEGLATIDYTVGDGGTPELTDTARVNVTVDAVNDAPTVVNPLIDATFAEDGPSQTLDLALVFDDVDIATSGDALTYAVAANTNAGLFDQVSISGTRLTLALAPDQNGIASVTIRASDLAGASAEDTFQVIVAPLNDIPVVVAPIQDVTVSEDSSDVTVDLAGVFTDADGPTNGDNLTFTLTAGGDDPVFASAGVNGDKLTLSFAPDQHGSADLTIRAQDLSGTFVDDTFRVTVTAVNDTPQLVSALADVTTDEDQDQTVELATHFDDVDHVTDGDTLTYSVVSNDNPTLLAATPVTGSVLALQLAPNMHGVARLTVRATDQAGAFVQDTFVLTVNAVNDAPVVASPIADFSLLEDDAPISLDLSPVFDDVDIPTDGDTLTVTLVGNTNPALFDDARVVGFFGARLMLDLAAEQNGSTDITLRATDVQGASVEETFRLTVVAVNDAPVLIARFDDVNVDEDAADVVIDLTQHFDDVDKATNDDALSYTITNSNPGIFASTNVAGDILTLDFGADRNGVATFTVSATDSAGAAVQDTFVVTVNAVNDAPFVARPIGDITLNEDDPNFPIDLVPVFDDVDFDNEGDAFTYSLQSTVDPVLFDDVSIDTASGGAVLTLDLAADRYGEATFTVRATDKDGISVDDTFRVVVLPVNDVPRAEDDSYAMDEDSGSLAMNVLANDFLEDAPVTLVSAGTTVVLDGQIYIGATESVPTTQVDTVGDPVTMPNGTVVVEADSTITYTPKPQFSGTDFFTYTIRDVDGELSTGTVTVNVAPINDAPFGFGSIEYSVEENFFLDVLAPGLLLHASDPDGDTMRVVLQQSTRHGELVINPDGSFTYTPKVDFTGNDSFTFFVSDGRLTSAQPMTVSLRVTPAPPPPAPPPEGEVEFDFQLADMPLELGVGTEPNVLVLMDDSGSMDWTLSAPEEQEGRFLISTRGMNGIRRQASTIYSYVLDLETNTYSASSSIGHVVPSEAALAADGAFNGNNYGVWRARTAKYNRLYYNPEVQYLPWRGLAPDNTPFANMDPARALLDPMDPSRATDLTAETSFTSRAVPRMDDVAATKNVNVVNFYIPRYYVTPASGPNLRWNDPHVLVEIRPGTTYQGSADRQDCAADDGNPFTCTYAQELQNFANWFSYYRSREYAAKNALGHVVAQASSIRVGYAAMNEANDRIPIKEMNASFRAGNKRDLLDQIYSIDSNGSTPLRSRLDQVGKYYECKSGNIFNLSASAPGNPACPVPAAPAGQCQLNYALVFTDGRWNGSFNSTNIDGPGSGNTAFDGGMYADDIGGTLADVAMNYYERDLHPSLADEVPTSGRDSAGAPSGAFGLNPSTMHQHVSTFAIQFGLSGNLTDADIPGDIRQSVDWGDPFSDPFAKTDDVRHMAVNGRGAFLTALDSVGLASTMQSVFDEFAAGEGAASAVSFNSQQISQDNLIYRAFYNTKINSGDLIAQTLDADGLLVEPPVWSAAEGLDNHPAGDRVIVTFDTDTSSPRYWHGVPFRYAMLSGEQRSTLAPEQVDYLRGDRANERPLGENYRERPVDLGLLGDIVDSTPVFVGPPSARLRDREPFPTDAGNLYSEFESAYAARSQMVAVGANDGMLHVFDGQSGEELLGYVPDKLINGEPYANPLYQLTSASYNHKFFVDLTPAVQDIFSASRTDFARKWRTVLVGGLRGGGKGYFAIDLTDPARFTTEAGAADQVLWEFTDADDISPDPSKLDLQGRPVKDLGYAFSQPTIVMTNAETGANPPRKRWAAVFGNGFNSTAGIAKLFALFIEDGVDGWDAGDFVKVDTGVGAPGAGQRNQGRPNALGTPRLVDVDGNGTADLAYAGDLRGNLYRFDMRDPKPEKWKATRIFTATYTQGSEVVPQPITNQPIVIANPQQDDGYVVIFGTGSFVTVPDATSTDIQSLYGIWDRLEAAPNITRDDLVEQEIVNLVDPAFGNVRTLSANPVNYAPPGTARGWVIDFDAERAATDTEGNPNPDQSGNATGPQFPGERAVRNLQLRGGFLFVNTVIPRDNTSCLKIAGGFQMALNPATGSLGGLREQIAFDLNGDGVFDDLDNAASGDIIAGMRFDDAVPTDSAFIGNRRYTQLSDRQVDVRNTNTNTGPRTGRLSWRQI